MKCPKCGNNRYSGFEWDGVYPGIGLAWNVLTCKDCGYSFDEIFEFSHYEDRETGDEIEIEA